MRIALLSDIHGNREALQACLAHAARQPHDAIAFLGDIVGYGADPVACTEFVMDEARRGAPVLMGNHEAALDDPAPDMNSEALFAIRWTRRRLDNAHADFLNGLAMTHAVENVLRVHASARAPSAFDYIDNPRSAERSLAACDARIVVAGHTHTPTLFSAGADGRTTRHALPDNIPVPLLKQRRWQVVLGAVGQPRDGNPAAAYAILDTAQGTIILHRVGYDVEAAAAKILEAGLPHRLAHRLAKGR